MAITLKQIDAELATFTTNRDALQKKAQEIFLLIFRHAAPKEVSEDCDGSGDCTRALKLVKAMPTSWAEQMVTYIRDMTPIRVVPKNDKCEYDPKYKALSKEEKLAWWKLAEVNETPFYEYSMEREIKIYDESDIEKMFTRVGPAIEKKIKDGVIKPEAIEYAKAVARAISAFKVERPVPAPANNDAPTNDDGVITKTGTEAA